MTLDLTIVILTKDESIHISRVLENVKGLAKRVVVVDSYSTDDTVEVAKAGGADVFENKFINQSKQFQWAIENVGLSTEWVMRVDADELIESDLREEMERELPLLPEGVSGINLRRKHIFMGRWVRYGGRYPVTLLRIWRNGRAQMEDRWMDEHIKITCGKTVTFHGGFSDCNLNNLTYFTSKHNSYATREAIEILIRHYGLVSRGEPLTVRGTSIQAVVKRLLKNAVYNRIPYELASLLYFLWRYIFQFGFLDGRSGLIYHFLQGFWYRFLVGAKKLELQRAIGSESDGGRILEIIRKETGIEVS